MHDPTDEELAIIKERFRNVTNEHLRKRALSLAKEYLRVCPAGVSRVEAISSLVRSVHLADASIE